MTIAAQALKYEKYYGCVPPKYYLAPLKLCEGEDGVAT
jgi:hypothetical protein